MVKLTLKDGKGYIPVAKIESKDKLNNEILFIDPAMEDDSSDSAEDDFDYNIQDVDYSKYFSKMKPRDAVMAQNTISRHLSKRLKPVDDGMASVYNRIKKDSAKDFKLKTGQFVPIPDINKERVIYYVFAPSGSGKTYFSASVLKQWLKLNPKKDVFIFSKLDDDKVIDDLGDRIKRIDISTLKESPIDISDIPQGSMVVFDDTDCIEDKAINDALLKLENSIYQVGRHHKISVIKTSHLGSDYKKTRVVLTECHYIVVYPSSGSFQQIKYVLSHYMGMSNEDIKKIKSLKSRWVLASKHFPQFVLSENECYLLGSK
jgi:hypothetical protein